MTLITDKHIAQLRANGRATLEAIRAGRDIDPTPIVKLYTPDAYCRWLLTELDPNGSDWAFGLFDLGHGHPHLGFTADAIQSPNAIHLRRVDASKDRFCVSRPSGIYSSHLECAA
jgi:hypothetical protein